MPVCMYAVLMLLFVIFLFFSPQICAIGANFLYILVVCFFDLRKQLILSKLPSHRLICIIILVL